MREEPVVRRKNSLSTPNDTSLKVLEYFRSSTVVLSEQYCSTFEEVLKIGRKRFWRGDEKEKMVKRCEKNENN